MPKHSHRFFTSDLHLGSTLINSYAKRPFATASDALMHLVKSINIKAGKDSLLVHVGDFMLKSADRHSKAGEDFALAYSQTEYLEMLEPQVFLLSGNHDDSHNCQTHAKSLTIDLDRNHKDVFVCHYPSYHRCYCGPIGGRMQSRLQINLCGHVHDKWLFMFDAKQFVLNVNVGVDVWNYAPVSDKELAAVLDKLMAIMPFGFYRSNWCINRRDFDALSKNYDAELARKREKRKAEKHAKKGLTLEECERRKQAALAKKLEKSS